MIKQNIWHSCYKGNSKIRPGNPEILFLYDGFSPSEFGERSRTCWHIAHWLEFLDMKPRRSELYSEHWVVHIIPRLSRRKAARAKKWPLWASKSLGLPHPQKTWIGGHQTTGTHKKTPAADFLPIFLSSPHSALLMPPLSLTDDLTMPSPNSRLFLHSPFSSSEFLLPLHCQGDVHLFESADQVLICETLYYHEFLFLCF